VAADLVLTVDAGGSGVKATVFSAAAGRLAACVRRGYRASFPAAGLAEWDPAAWWRVIVAACREAVERAGGRPADYAGLVFTGMRGPFVLVDGDGEHVAPGVLVPDQRGAPYLERIERAVGRDVIYERTGHWLSSRWGLSKLLWFADAAPAALAGSCSASAGRSSASPRRPG
jgi:xylulokinase